MLDISSRPHPFGQGRKKNVNMRGMLAAGKSRKSTCAPLDQNEIILAQIVNIDALQTDRRVACLDDRKAVFLAQEDTVNVKSDWLVNVVSLSPTKYDPSSVILSEPMVNPSIVSVPLSCEVASSI